jgi:hypothetical protein
MIMVVTASISVMTIKTVEAAFTSGVTLNRTIEKILMGNVVEPGPDVKKVITKSSRDSVRARRAPATMPGTI